MPAVFLSSSSPTVARLGLLRGWMSLEAAPKGCKGAITGPVRSKPGCQLMSAVPVLADPAYCATTHLTLNTTAQDGAAYVLHKRQVCNNITLLKEMKIAGLHAARTARCITTPRRQTRMNTCTSSVSNNRKN
jgi:hypothetical protein